MLPTSADAASRSPHTRALTTGDRGFLHYTRLHPGECLEHGVMLYVDDPTLTVAELRAHVARRLRVAPALAERLSQPSGSGSRDDTVWEIAHDLDLDYHVGAVDVPTGTGDDGLRTAVDRVTAPPLDLERPLWRIWLLRGHSPDRVALVYWSNHLHQDGHAMHQALHLLFGPDGEPAMRNLPTFGSPRPRDYLRMVGTVLRGIPRAPQLAAWGGPPRGEARHAWALAELETLRQIARRHAVSINDVFLAATAGALRAWSLPEWERRQRPLHAAMPISLRADSERDLMSNFTFGARVRLPCAEPDPLRRLALVAEDTLRAKAGGSLAVVGRLILDRTPQTTSPKTFAHAASGGARPREAALLASNVGTMRGPFAVAGRAVSALVGLPALFVGRQHLAMALFGLGTQSCIAITASESVPRYAELPGLWLAELAALGGAVPARTTAAAA